MVAADWLTPFVIVSGDPTCTDLITQPELRRILTNQQWGLVGVSVTSWYPTGALISDNQGCNTWDVGGKPAPDHEKKVECAEAIKSAGQCWTEKMDAICNGFKTAFFLKLGACDFVKKRNSIVYLCKLFWACFQKIKL